MERIVKEPKYLTFNQINEIVQVFLSEVNCQDKIPVPIEDIVTNLNFDVIPSFELNKKLGIEGFILPSKNELYVDKDIHDHPCPYRYNSTLAHEMGHLVLHREYIEEFYSESDYESFLTTFNERWLERIELQAWGFARLLLIPSKVFPKVYDDFKKIYPSNEFSKLEKEYPDFLAQKFSLELSKKFCVSDYIAKIRIRNYIDNNI